MKILNSEVGIFSDPHYGLHRDSTLWHQTAIEHAKWAAAEFKKRSIRDIIIPGDVFDDRNDVAVTTLQTASQIFDILKDFNIIITTGNHDAYYKDRSDITSISILKGWSNITIVDTLTTYQYNKTSIAFCPWGQNIKEVPPSNLIFGHFSINSFSMYPGKVCTDGFAPSDFHNNSKLTISGHFHIREERKYPKGTILYVGCPYQHNWSDCGTTKGLYILDLDTLKYEFIENTISPVHNKIFYTKMVKGEYSASELKALIKNNIIKFIIDAKVEQEEVDLITKKLQSLHPREFLVEYEYNDEIKVNTELAQETNFNVSVETSINEFVDIIEVKHKDKVKQYILDVYHKAQAEV